MPETTPIFVHVMQSPANCAHEFNGWRDFPDGTGGEQVCSKCGIGAMAWSLYQADEWEEKHHG